MKILSWNCNGALRKKYKYINELDVDVFVIQECENPAECLDKQYLEFAKNYLWVGYNKHKGLGIFGNKDIILSRINWNAYCLRHFISVRINNKYNLLGVWTNHPIYIEEYYIYQNININNFDKNTIIIGDFNSNAIWNKHHKQRNHSKVVEELEKIGLKSVYHYIFNEQQGKETHGTFYMHKDINKQYHIDHCFANIKLVKNYEILDKRYLKYSDHVPILVDLI